MQLTRDALVRVLTFTMVNSGILRKLGAKMSCVFNFFHQLAFLFNIQYGMLYEVVQDSCMSCSRLDVRVSVGTWQCLSKD